MKNQQFVQYAVLCLQALDANGGRPLSVQDLSHSQGVPFATCVRLINRLSDVGIVEVTSDGVTLRRPVEDLTALEIVQAIWSDKEKSTGFRMLVGGVRGMRAKVTRALAQITESSDSYGVCNG